MILYRLISDLNKLFKMQQQPDFIKLKVGKSELLCKESVNAITEQLLKRYFSALFLITNIF